MTKVISVTVFFNAEPYVENHIKSLRDNNVDKIIVVDNASSDGSIEALKSSGSDIIIQNDENEGFAKACNKGITEALLYNPEYILIINQDAYLHPKCLDKMLKVADAKKFALYSPMHYYRKEVLDKAFSKYIKKANKERDVFKVNFVNAACWLVPLNTIKTIGIFDPLFFFTGEDIDYFNRMKYFNLDAAVIKDAKMTHDRDQGKSLNNKSHVLFEKSLEADFIQRLKNINTTWFIGVIKCLMHLGRIMVKTGSIKPLKIMLSQFNNHTIFMHRNQSRQGAAFLPASKHG